MKFVNLSAYTVLILNLGLGLSTAAQAQTGTPMVPGNVPNSSVGTPGTNSQVQRPQSSSGTVNTLEPATDERPNSKRIRRQLNLVVGVTHDEEFRIPNREITAKGRTNFFEGGNGIKRIEGTDYFRFFPTNVGNGIVSLHDKKTGQLLVEIHFDIRDDAAEKTLREVQAMLADIEGIEFKIVNGIVHLDGYVLVPRDLMRIGQVISTWGPDRVKSLVTLSPIARKKIVEFIANDVNNPEVKISAVGDYIKLEGQVNNEAERQRIRQIVQLYIPDMVIETSPNAGFVQIRGRKNEGRWEDLVVDLITVKTQEEKVEPPPKMIQIVAHFVKFNDNYLKSFNFSFSPVLSAVAGTENRQPTSTIGETAQLISNLLPKLNWAKVHGYAKVLDTAYVLTQDRVPGLINRTVQSSALVAGENGSLQQTPAPPARVELKVTPVVKSERSGLITLQDLTVLVSTPSKSEATTTNIQTTISVRDRQSAAFGGILKKDSETNYGTPANPDAVITLEASKGYTRNNSQFVVFVTPIIKSSASAGVEQVKKKFRVRD